MIEIYSFLAYFTVSSVHFFFKQLRMASLRCLAKVPSCINSSILSPWRQQTLKSLELCLNDPKRLVRREAVDCRNRWYGNFLCIILLMASANKTFIGF